TPGDQFGGNGTVTTPLGSARDLALQPDGKIVVAGTTFGPDGKDFTLARYLSDGSLDTNFHQDGFVTTDITGGDEEVSGLPLQADGKIVVVGSSEAFANPIDFVLARYNSNGHLDSPFGRNGKVTTDLGGADRANGLALQADGRIVVAGSTRNLSGFTD